MKQDSLVNIIAEQTERALWEVKNVIGCIPDALWEKAYCGAPCWQHVYHMLHSLDRWFINPRDKAFREPELHAEGLNDLDTPPVKTLSRDEIDSYYQCVCRKVRGYLADLPDECLLAYPPDCEYTRFTLILAQFRHLHSHMGMLMGFVINDTGLWPRVLGLEQPFPEGDYEKYL